LFATCRQQQQQLTKQEVILSNIWPNASREAAATDYSALHIRFRAISSYPSQPSPLLVIFIFIFLLFSPTHKTIKSLDRILLLFTTAYVMPHAR
jgi:hypothetical protein